MGQGEPGPQGPMGPKGPRGDVLATIDYDSLQKNILSDPKFTDALKKALLDQNDPRFKEFLSQNTMWCADGVCRVTLPLHISSNQLVIDDIPYSISSLAQNKKMDDKIMEYQKVLESTSGNLMTRQEFNTTVSNTSGSLLTTISKQIEDKFATKNDLNKIAGTVSNALSQYVTTDDLQRNIDQRVEGLQKEQVNQMTKILQQSADIDALRRARQS